MRIERILPAGCTTDPFDECCVGTHEGETIRLHEENLFNPLTIEVKEFRSGIGPSYKITAYATNGQVSKDELWTYIDDDGNLTFTLKESQA